MSLRIACVSVLALIGTLLLLQVALADREATGSGAVLCSSVVKVSTGKAKEFVSVETLKCPAPTVKDNTPADRKAN